MWASPISLIAAGVYPAGCKPRGCWQMLRSDVTSCAAAAGQRGAAVEAGCDLWNMIKLALDVANVPPNGDIPVGSIWHSMAQTLMASSAESAAAKCRVSRVAVIARWKLVAGLVSKAAAVAGQDISCVSVFKFHRLATVMVESTIRPGRPSAWSPYPADGQQQNRRRPTARTPPVDRSGHGTPRLVLTIIIGTINPLNLFNIKPQ